MLNADLHIVIEELGDHKFHMDIKGAGNTHVLAHGLIMFLEQQPELQKEMAKIASNEDSQVKMINDK